MFGFLKGKSKKEKIFYSMVTGKSIDLSEVNDEMFAGRVLGDGIAVWPEEDVFSAPCTGNPLVKVDRQMLREEKIPDVSMLVFIEPNGHKLTKFYTGQTVEAGTSPLVEYE